MPVTLTQIPPVPSSITNPIEKQFFEKLRKQLEGVYDVTTGSIVGLSGNYVFKSGDTMTGALILQNLQNNADELVAVDNFGELKVTGTTISEVLNAISDNTDLINDNTTLILGVSGGLQAQITSNDNDIAQNVSDIASNLTLINTISGDLDLLELGVANNTSDIASNLTLINTISGDLDLLELDVTQNTSDIASNLTLINTISGDLDLLELDVAQNVSDIASNLSLINTISGDLDLLETQTNGITGGLTQLNDLYVNISGDTMTGTLDVPTLTLGLSGQDAYIYYDNEVVGSPALRYNSSTSAWQLSNEGTFFSDIQIKGGAGALSKATITDNGDGTIDVDSINVILYSDSSWSGAVAEYVVPSATNLALTIDAVNYLCARYNGGNPEYYITADDAEITDSDIVVVSRLYRHDFDIHHLENSWGLSTPSRLNRRFIEQQRYVRTEGLALSESTGNVIEIGAGVIWWGIEQFEESAVSSISGNCEFWYHVSGVWEHSTVSTYNNTHYDDGTDLVALANNKYVTNWVFRFVNGDGLEQVAYVLGNDEYNGASSSAGAPQPIFPPILESNAILVGRITVQKNATTASIIDSAFDSVYTGSIVTQHNNLSDLQGGTTSEYYHLTSSEHAEVQALSTTISALSGTYVAKTGDTMTGPLEIAYNPATENFNDPAFSVTMDVNREFRMYKGPNSGIILSCDNQLGFGIAGNQDLTFRSGYIEINSNLRDKDFRIRKYANATYAYEYNTGNDTHTFNGDMGFFGTTPVSQPTSLTMALSGSAGATYTSSEQDLINNLKTRIGELESKLQSLGLLGV